MIKFKIRPRKVIPKDEIPPEYFIENEDIKYRKWYDNIIDRAKSREELDEPFEVHHIIPLCLGGTNDLDNLVPLTIKEHIVVHKILVRIFPNCVKLVNAVIAMSLCNETNENRDGVLKYFSTNEIVEYRKLAHENMRGKPMPEERKRKISEALKGKPKSESARKNISKAAKRRFSKYGANFKGEHHSKETKKLLSEKKKAYIKETGIVNFKGEHHSDKTKEVLSNKMKDRYKNGYKPPMIRKVMDPDGRIFNSITECAEYYGVTRTAITNKIKRTPEKGFKYID